MTPEKINQQETIIDALSDKLHDVKIAYRLLESASEDLRMAKNRNADTKPFDESYQAQRLICEQLEDEFKGLFEQLQKLNTQPLDIVNDAGLTQTDTISVELNANQVSFIKEAIEMQDMIDFDNALSIDDETTLLTQLI